MKTKQLLPFILLGLMFMGTSCKKKNNDPDIPTDPDSEISLQIQTELDEGRDFYDMWNDYGTYNLIGKRYQGGLIYHIDIADLEGYVCAETDQSIASPWGCEGLFMIESWYGGIGGGRTNSTIITMDCSEPDIAVRKCYIDGEYDGWYLPSTGSMEAMFDELVVLRNMDIFSKTELYWTSTGKTDDSDRAWTFEFGEGNQSPKPRSDEYRVRAVRKFEF